MVIILYRVKNLRHVCNLSLMIPVGISGNEALGRVDVIDTKDGLTSTDEEVVSRWMNRNSLNLIRLL
jgi:hypothetical protein